jgi:hypothetical protein
MPVAKIASLRAVLDEPFKSRPATIFPLLSIDIFDGRGRRCHHVPSGSPSSGPASPLSGGGPVGAGADAGGELGATGDGLSCRRSWVNRTATIPVELLMTLPLRVTYSLEIAQQRGDRVKPESFERPANASRTNSAQHARGARGSSRESAYSWCLWRCKPRFSPHLSNGCCGTRQVRRLQPQCPATFNTEIRPFRSERAQ